MDDEISRISGTKYYEITRLTHNFNVRKKLIGRRYDYIKYTQYPKQRINMIQNLEQVFTNSFTVPSSSTWKKNKDIRNR